MRDDRFVIFFFGTDNKPPEVIEGLQSLLETVNEYTKKRRLFSVYRIGECVGDFS